MVPPKTVEEGVILRQMGKQFQMGTEAVALPWDTMLTRQELWCFRVGIFLEDVSSFLVEYKIFFPSLFHLP